MKRRVFLQGSAIALFTGVGSTITGCKNYAEIMTDDQANMVGTNAAGAATFQPMVEQAMGRLLARQGGDIQLTGGPAQPVPKHICFVGLKNDSAEELGDFKIQIEEIIRNQVTNSPSFVLLSEQFVTAGLRQLRIRPDELFVPRARASFAAVMEQNNTPFDYFLYARLTSGTTQANSSRQRNYMLTLQLIDIHTGVTVSRDSATIRKGYHKNRFRALWH
ncbi:MAG: penicillin-binding protein activator LpoB [Gemmataceae bacterium]